MSSAIGNYLKQIESLTRDNIRLRERIAELKAENADLYKLLKQLRREMYGNTNAFSERDAKG